MSEFVRQMIKEDQHWETVIADYSNSPANGVRGKGQKRKTEYEEQDQNLRLIFESRQTREPYDYLKAIAYRMPDPVV
jgi:hypothetical protein